MFNGLDVVGTVTPKTDPTVPIDAESHSRSPRETVVVSGDGLHLDVDLESGLSEDLVSNAVCFETSLGSEADVLPVTPATPARPRVMAGRSDSVG